MLAFVTVLIAAGFGLIFKFRERLAFRHGRLSRPFNRAAIAALTSMGPDQFIELSFGKVHYIYRPSSSTTKTPETLNIFVHGFSIPMEMWQDIFESMTNDNHACLVFDLYGRGWSDAPSVPMNVDLFVCQLAELLYALNLPYEKYNLFGVSMGGVIVQRFTELYPSKVSKLILCCSAGLKLAKPSNLITSILSIPVLGPMLFRKVMQRDDSRAVRAQWAFPDKDKYQQYRNLHKRAWEQHPGYLRSLYSTVLNFDFESAHGSVAIINRLNIPVLIIWGDKDVLIPVENGYQYHSLYKNSKLKIIEGGNHSILIEHSREAIEAIQPFLSDK